MKTKLSKFIIGMSTFGIGLIALPTLASCSSSIDDLERVDRGDGSLYASYGDDFKITFKDEITNALVNKSSFNAFKKQYANQLLYNFYKKIVDSGKIQSFKDDWDTWNKDIDEDYDNKVQSSKDKNGSNWEFYFQNEVLDPAGGTTEAWKYNQLCSKIREDFKSKVFANKYLAYSTESTYNVNNNIVSTFDQEIFFEHPENWRQINFYAKNKTGGNYNTDRDLDDIYALIQKLAFEKYTSTNHPFSVSMCLWKYETPSSMNGVLDVYSNKINNNNADSLSDDDGLTPSYEFPTFAEFNGDSSANGKFWHTIRDVLLNNASYSLTPTGFSNIPNDKWYTDDSATQIIVQSSDLSSLDAMFGGAAANLWADYSGNTGTGKFVSDKILKYDIHNLLSDTNVEASTDILRNFFFRSNDSRLFNTDGSLTQLGTDLAACENKIDLNDLYESVGTAGKLENNGGNADFHSKIFRTQSPLFFDYYGDTNLEGGVQWVVSALRLYDGNKALPYVLIRDEMSEAGIHIIGLNGATTFNKTTGAEQNGYLSEPKDDTNDNTEPFSQGRENILLKAQYLWEKGKSSTTINLESKIEDFFKQDDNMNDIIISMAKNKTTRENDNQAIIFNDDEMFNVVRRDDFYNLISSGNDYFAAQSTISAIDSENKKLFDKKFTNVKNSITSRSDSLSKITKANYQNGMSTPYPFTFTEPDNYSSTGYICSLVSFDINGIMAWEKGHIYDLESVLADDVWDKNEITFDEVKLLKQNYIDNITNMITAEQGIAPDIQTSGTAKYSEHIYNKWNKNNPLSVAVYAALESFGGSDSFSNNVKIKAMRNYISSCFPENSIVDSFDSFNGYASIKTQTLKNAFVSYYETSKLLSLDKPLSMYQSFDSVSSISSYIDLVDNIFKTNLNRSYLDIDYSSDMYDYLLVLDALQYLVKDNYANLINYLKNNVIRYGDDANIVWISEENTDCVPDFAVDQATIKDEVNKNFSFQKNYYGQYSNTYFNNSGSNDTPSSYITNDAYYRSAPMPTKGTGTNTEWVDAMGYVGLVTSSDTTSPITSAISDQIFKNAYYTKREIVDNNIVRKGGWYKYIDFDTLISKIRICSGTKDVIDLIDNLADDLSESNFTNYVKAIASRSFYEESDPEVVAGTAKIGDPVSVAVLKDRVIGDKDMYKHQDVSWGLTTYKSNHEALVNSMFQPFGNKDSVAEVCNGDDTQNIKHTIKTITDDEAHNQARVMVLQLNSNDVSSYDNLFAALGGSSGGAETLINLIAVQYAMNSSIKNLALQDVIKVNFNGEKITVYDRRFNDKLGRVWVKDWKSTN